MNSLAERYVRLVLALGVHDADYVDAYYGPAGWRKDAETTRLSLQEIDASAEVLTRELAAAAPAPDRLRARAPAPSSCEAARGTADARGDAPGRRLRFDEESKALYDAVAPNAHGSGLREVLAALDEETAGPGPAPAALRRVPQPLRHPARASRCHVPGRDRRMSRPHPPARRAAGRRELHGRVRQRQALERLQLVPGQLPQRHSGQHGPADLSSTAPSTSPATRAIPDTTCTTSLLEQNLVRDRGWIEFSVYPLFSPQSLIAEGTADYGIDVAFPTRRGSPSNAR